MKHFISQASDEIQGLFRLQANTMDEFQSMVQYFGEDPKKTTTTEIFGIFADFITKFEVNVNIYSGCFTTKDNGRKQNLSMPNLEEILLWNSIIDKGSICPPRSMCALDSKLSVFC